MLDAEVIRHYMQIRWRQLETLVSLLQGIAVEVSPVIAVPLVSSLGAHHLGQIGAIHLADAARLEDKFVRICLERRNDPAQHAMGAQMTNHSACVNLSDYRNVKAFQVFFRHLLRAPIRAYGRELARDQSLDIRAAGLVVGGVGSVVSDLWIGQDNNLSSVGRIGKDFLVASQGGIENHFAKTFASGAIALTAEDAPVFEREDCLHGFSVEWIYSSLTGRRLKCLVDNAHVLRRPIDKRRLAVNQIPRHRSKVAAVTGN